MSHASLIVALSPAELERAGGDLEKAVEFQMAPFDENGEMFAEGSRWDWWQIGGRYTGKFAPDYEPGRDEANQQTCWLCSGTGLRNDDLGRGERLKDPAYTCNGCQGTGTMTKHASEWQDVGNVTRRGDLDLDALILGKQQRAAKLWAEWQAEPRKDDAIREFRYGLRADDCLDTVTARMTAAPLCAYAFLRNREWNEQGRMGWFARTAATECAVSGDGPNEAGRCVHEHAATGARIVSWGEDDEGEQSDKWNRRYFQRFIAKLPPETILVVVDYHV